MLIEKISRIGWGYRILSLFICLICLISLVGIAVYGIKDNGIVHGLTASIIPLAMLYVFAPIGFTGRPPRLLWFSVGPKD